MKGNGLVFSCWAKWVIKGFGMEGEINKELNTNQCAKRFIKWGMSV